MKLSDLPPELLRAILNGRTSWAVLELWKAGDRVLNSKLVNHGITDMDLRDFRNGSTSRWPQCLKEFKLQRLSLTGRFTYPTEALRREIQQLHSGLRVLSLYLPQALDAVLPLPKRRQVKDFGSDPTQPLLSHSAHSSTDNAHTYWDLGLTWPSLERLELSTGYVPFGPQTDLRRYGAHELSLLPRSLTWLELPSAAIIPEALPPGLKTLRVQPSLALEDLHRLPTSITDLKGSVAEPALLLIFDNPQLLPDLKRFPVEDFDLVLSAPIKHVREPAVQWPEIMLTLKTSTYDHRIFGVLPSSMTSLTLRRVRGDVPLLPTTIPILPRGLTYLSVIVIEWKEIDVNSWPSTLTTLLVDNEKHFHLDCFHLLPRNLKSVSIGMRSHESRFSLYPIGDDEESNLDFDALHAFGRASLASDPEWPTMKHEILRSDARYAPLEALEAYIESIESGRLYGLPLTLTSIGLPHLLLDKTSTLLFPPRVKSPRYQQNRKLVEGPSSAHYLSLLLAALPPNASSHFKITSYNSVQGILQPESDLLLNSKITSLTFDAPAHENLFESLPRSLLGLHIPTYSFYAKYVRLGAKAPNSPQASFNLPTWVRQLPRTLTTLYVPMMTITGQQIKDLPRQLTFISCSFFEVSLPQVLDLPRALSSLSVSKCGGLETTLLRHCLTTQAWNTLISTYRPFWRIWEAGLTGMAIELSIAHSTASKTNRVSPNAHHSGTGSSDPPPGHLLQEATVDDMKYDYTSENVERFLEATQNDSDTLDPRASRRIAGYL